MTADPVAVLLVGAGPGDPDLVTLDAEKALRGAREVVADRTLAPLVEVLVADGEVGPLVALPSDGDEIRRSIPGGAGAWTGDGRGSGQSLVVTWVADDQPAPASLLAAIDRGPGVARLYRGDPWFHPAGDAERAALRAAGVGFEFVAGVVPELAAAAAAGLPVQVRTLAVITTFTIDERGGSSAPDGASAPTVGGGWGAPGTARPVGAVPADPAHTLVVRTTDLAATAAWLADVAGRDGIDLERPAAALPTGAPRGRVEPLRTTLRALARRAPAGPGVVVVGLVAALDTGLGFRPAETSPGSAGTSGPIGTAPARETSTAAVPVDAGSGPTGRAG